MSDFNSVEPTDEVNASEVLQNPEQPSLFEEPTPPENHKKGFVKEAIEYLEIFVLAVGLVLLMFSFVFRVCTVEGASMENTLHEGDHLLVTDMFYTPKRGDVVIFHQTGDSLHDLNKPIVKRVIATEGETVNITYTDTTMKVTVTDTDGNTFLLEEDAYMLYDGAQLYYYPMSFTVPEGSLFVMGDNRNDSLDSRNSLIGMVDERRVLGKVLCRLPF